MDRVRRFWKAGFLGALVIVLIVTVGSPVLQAQEQGGGHLRSSVHSTPVTLDPHKQVGDAGYILSNLVYEGLTKLNQEQQVVPALATSWDSSEDLKTWTFYLRKGVTFHDGTPFTAEDVVFSIERILNPDTASAGHGYFSAIVSVEAIDLHTVQCKLDAPYGDLPGVCTVRHGKMIPKHAVDEIATKPIGTGPFMFESYVSGEQYVLLKNPNYWKEGLPYLDQVTVKVIPEISTDIMALKSGEIDLLWRLPPDQVEHMEREADITVSSIAVPKYDTIIMDAETEPFTDPRVIAAVKYCIDRDTLLEAAIFGHGVVAFSPIASDSPYYNPSAKPREQDYAIAKELLAKAGYPNGLEITLYIPSGRVVRERTGIALQQMLAPAGIAVKIQRVPLDKFYADIEFNAAFYVTGFSARPTIDTATYPMFYSTGSWNLAHWKNDEVDALLDAARQTTDFEKKKYYYQRLQELIIEYAPFSIPYLVKHFDAFNNRVKNYQCDPFTLQELETVYIED